MNGHSFTLKFGQLKSWSFRLRLTHKIFLDCKCCSLDKDSSSKEFPFYKEKIPDYGNFYLWESKSFWPFQTVYDHYKNLPLRKHREKTFVYNCFWIKLIICHKSSINIMKIYCFAAYISDVQCIINQINDLCNLMTQYEY